MKGTAKEYRAACDEVSRLVQEGLTLNQIGERFPIIYQAWKAGPPAKETEAELKSYKDTGKPASTEVDRLAQQYVRDGEAEDYQAGVKLVAKNEPKLYQQWVQGK